MPNEAGERIVLPTGLAPQAHYPCAALPSAPSSCVIWVVLTVDEVFPCRRSCVLCRGCGGVLGGQSVQYAAAVFGQYGLLKEGLKLLLGQRDGVG